MHADRKTIFAAVLVAVVTLIFAQAAEACPSCQRALSDGSQGDLAAGIYYSILFMMSMPFAIVGVFGSVAYRAVQRERRRVAQEDAKRANENSSSLDETLLDETL